MRGTVVRKFVCLIGVFVFLLPGLLFGQEREKVSLYTIILQLETEHQILFSYVIDEVKAVAFEAPLEGLSLEETLTYINENTPFRVQKLSDRYYTVARNVAEDSRICGSLVDSASGMPMSNASIQVANANYATLSGNDGRFFLPNNLSDATVEISFLGYETITIPISKLGENCPQLLMVSSISELNEVLISSFLVKGINRNSDGSTSLNTENFGLVPGQTENDVLQIAQTLPGVASVNETISTINIRGGTNDENLILWEGIRMYQTGHFFGLISAFNPNLTQELTLYKNGTPAQFGESVSGVISMGSNNNITEEFRGGVGSNLINTNAFLEFPISKKLGVQLSGRTSINGLFETPVYNNFSDRVFQDTEITNNQNSAEFTDVLFQEDFYFYDIGGKLLWDPSENDQVRLSFIAMENHFEFSERLSESEETSRLEQKSQAAGIQWRHQWSNRFSTTASFHVSHYLLDALNQDIFTTQEINQENEVLDLGVKLDSRWHITESWQLASGYQFLEVGVSNIQDVNLPRFRDYTRNVLRSHIVHSSLNYRSPNNKTRAVVGLRGNYFEKFSQITVEPRLHLYQELVDGFALELGGEMKSQTLTQRIDLQSDFLGVEKRRWVLADEEEVPVKMSQQASLGFLFNKRGWFVNVEGFYKKVNDITSKSQGFQNQFQFSTTTGNYSISGIEFIINKKWRQFSGWIGYGYSNNEYDFASLTPSTFPNNLDIKHTVNVAGTYEWKQFKFALGMNWRTGKPYTLPNENARFEYGDGFLIIPFNDPNEERLPDYLRVDFSTEYLWTISEGLAAKFNLALLNLTGKENTLNIRYALDDPFSFESEINRIEEVSLGFTPNFSVQLLF